jgi:hypothetical protein
MITLDHLLTAIDRPEETDMHVVCYGPSVVVYTAVVRAMKVKLK